MQSIAIDPYYHSRQKRVFDVLLSSLLLLALSPVFIVLSSLLSLTLSWPVLFLQERQGKDKKSFNLLKFRTMVTTADHWKPLLRAKNEAPEPMFKMQHDPRFIGIGRWLSRSGLDELPQLVNILRGEMSFVGPRPLPIAEAEQLPASWDFRYSVRPGLVSEWVLNEKKYESLRAWRSAELFSLKNGSTTQDTVLLVRAILLVLRWSL